MSTLKGDFMDSNNIIIVNNVPCFSFKGHSYLEKLKNGLSLDYVFFMEDSAVNADDENFEEKVEESQYQPLKHELFDEAYDIDVLPMPRKGKKNIKKEGSTNLKKTKLDKTGLMINYTQFNPMRHIYIMDGLTTSVTCIAMMMRLIAIMCLIAETITMTMITTMIIMFTTTMSTTTGHIAKNSNKTL